MQAQPDTPLDKHPRGETCPARRFVTVDTTDDTSDATGCKHNRTLPWDAPRGRNSERAWGGAIRNNGPRRGVAPGGATPEGSCQVLRGAITVASQLKLIPARRGRNAPHGAGINLNCDASVIAPPQYKWGPASPPGGPGLSLICDALAWARE